jgi:hypothetical protein
MPPIEREGIRVRAGPARSLDSRSRITRPRCPRVGLEQLEHPFVIGVSLAGQGEPTELGR